MIGSLGVMLAWLLWVAIAAFEQNALRVLIAPAIGAAVGLGIEFLIHLVRAAAREAREGPTPPPVMSESDRQRAREAPDYAARGGTVALAFMFLYGVCQNLVGDLMSRLLTPFLVTLAIFFPVGMWFGFVFRDRIVVESAPMHALRGLTAGAVAAAIAFAISFGLGLADFEFGTLLGFFGWWGLAGIGWALTLGDCDETRPFAPLLGTLLATMLLLISGAPANSNAGAFSLLRPVTDRLAGQVLAYPGLPAKFWQRSVEELEPPAPPATTPPPPAPQLRVRPLPRPLPTPLPITPDPTSERQRLLDRQLALGLRSDLARSWLIMLLFSGAFGAARWLEQRLRPRDYERSETLRNDRRLGLATVTLWLGGVLWVALHGW